MYTPEEVREIVSAHPTRGWPPIPADCPVEIRAKIIEYRAKKMGIHKDRERETEREALQAQLDTFRS